MIGNKIEMWQGVAAFVGITLGLIPLIGRVLAGSTGSLWQLAPGGGNGAPALTAAVVVLVAALATIGVLERRKRA